MKNLFRLAATAALLATTNVFGFNYHDGDLLLIFRKDGYNDIEYNLGPVTSIVNHPAGTVTPVTNWDVSKATDLYSLTDDVRVILVACTSKDIPNRVAWLTCGDDAVNPQDRTASQWQTIWSKVSGIGDAAARFTQTNNVQYYSISFTDLSAYTYIASNGGSSPTLVPKLGGASVFPIESTLPAALRFFEIKPSTLIPKPAAKLTGTFSMSAEGALTFQAGASLPDPVLPPLIETTTRGNGVTEITIASSAGVSYRLRSTNAAGLGSPISTWSVGAAVAGTGASISLSSASSDQSQFYVVEAFR